MEQVRTEVKYALNKDEFSSIKTELASLMNYDVHSDENGYTTASLYFDTADDKDFATSLAGLSTREKIRLRYYDSPGNKYKLEYKKKDEGQDTKPFISLDKSQAQRIVNGEYDFLNVSDTLHKALYEKLIQGGYTPKIIVLYHRIAFDCPQCKVRITYDTNLRYTTTIDAFFNGNSPMTSVITPYAGVLEVKCEKGLPKPIEDVIKKVNTRPITIGKYALARQSQNS